MKSLSLETLAKNLHSLTIKTFTTWDINNMDINIMATEFLDDWNIPMTLRSEKHAWVCRAIASAAALTHLTIPCRSTFRDNDATRKALKKIREQTNQIIFISKDH